MPEARDPDSERALAGVRVIDMASLYAAPLAASLLADFGADVVKLEPPEGDSFRGTRLWPLVARGKRSVTADLRTPEGCAPLPCTTSPFCRPGAQKNAPQATSRPAFFPR